MRTSFKGKKGLIVAVLILPKSGREYRLETRNKKKEKEKEINLYKKNSKGDWKLVVGTADPDYVPGKNNFNVVKAEVLASWDALRHSED